MSKEEKAAVPFEQHVWDVLSRIDVTEHCDYLPATKKRPAVAYLSWHRGWALLKRNFPASTYSHRPDLIHADGTMEVEVDIVISYDGTSTMFTNSRLGVMDNWFNAIANPDARQINDSRQRAMVKALAFAGLGLNLWSDSNIPVGKLVDPINPDQVDQINALLESTGSDRDRFLKWCEVEELEDMPFERFSSALGLLEAKARRLAQQEQADD